MNYLKTRGNKISVIAATLIAFLFSSSLFAQNEANMWYFGTQAGINFNNTPPTKFSNGLTNSGNENGEGVATMADPTTGATLFYTDGVTVWNSSGIMTGGNGTLKGSKSSIESAVAVPQPGANPNKLYYIFTVPCEEASGAFTTGGSKNPADGLNYTVVNMTTAAGNIAAAQTNILMTPAGVPVTEALSAIPDNLNTGFWVVCHQAGNKSTGGSSNRFYAYHVRPGNVNTATGVITFTAADIVTSDVGTAIAGVTAPPAVTASSNSQATMKSNSCFTRLAFGFFGKAKLIEVFPFSNTSGVVSPMLYNVTNFNAADVNEVYGIEFSPDGKTLYASVLGQSSAPGILYSFNVTSEASATINTAGNTSRRVPTVSAPVGELQLAPDGNIYYSFFYTNPIGSGAANAYVGQISNPNTFPGTFNDTYFTWGAADNGVASKMGLPQIYKGFVAGVGSIEPGAGITKLDSVCVGELFDLKGSYPGVGTNWKWNIDANLNATIDYNVQNPSNVSYATAGTYDVDLDFQDATCLTPVHVDAQIVVSPKVTAAGTITCPNKGNVTSPNGAYSYVWYSDAAGTKPIGTGTTNVALPIAGSGNVYVRAESGVVPVSTSPTLRNTGTMNTWSGGAGTVVTFTVTNPITLNGFDWGNGVDPGWPQPPTPETMTIKNAAGTTTYYTVTRNTTSGVAFNQFTESGLNLLLPAGNYQIIFNANGADWSLSTNASDANVSITGNAGKIHNFNYSVTNYTVTKLICSQISAAIPYNCPLPVQFASFIVLKSGNNALLEWISAQETNNNYFSVEKSLDGVTFFEIGKVAGAGNSHDLRTYNFTDKNISSGVTYYRIKQVDYDGNYSYTVVRSINTSAAFDFTVSPNPNNGEFNIYVTTGEVAENYTVEVMNLLGVTILKEEKNNSNNVIRMNLSSLPKGVYLVKLSDDESSHVAKVVVE